MSVRLDCSARVAKPGGQLECVLINDGPGGCSFGHEYSLERNEGEDWVRCNVEEAWTLNLISLRPGREFRWMAHVPSSGPAGCYRVRKEIANGPGKYEHLVFEFDVILPAA